MSDAVKSLVLPVAIGGAAVALVCLGLAVVLLVTGAAGGGTPPVANKAGGAGKEAALAGAQPPATAVNVEAASPPAPSPAAPGEASAAPPPAPAAPYSLQLGAFLDRPGSPGAADNGAKALIAAAAARGYSPKAVPFKDAAGRDWIAVRLGAYADEAAAALAADELRLQAGLSSTIVSAAVATNG